MRPENVRCKNCVFWDREDDGVTGACSRIPPLASKKQDGCHWPFTLGFQWCGEFRSEWPEVAR